MMQRTIVTAPRPAPTAGTRDRLSDPKWSAPRISAVDIPRFVGRDVTLIAEAMSIGDGTITFECLVSRKPFTIKCTSDPELSKINEVTVYVAAPDQLIYVSHGMVNDEFDAKSYTALLNIIHNHHPELFGI